ncbi:response regulator [Spirosoma aureum]|uniref:Response regulator n=1 Tax=Spirosoma aureum TaxID=2692134 RepID=A0A6G9AN36_9BACT|nr:response regulator [Spirosoma aureum]QIP13734.1 response regulator [Spirosoma aureum]
MLDILYIEDNLNEIDIFKRVLSHLVNPPSFTVLSNGSDAIDYLLQQGIYEDKTYPMPRLVLIDLNLPGQNGFEVIQQVRANTGTKYLPLLVYSISDLADDIRRAYNLGANAYLIKPQSYQEVSELMRRAIDFWLTPNQYVR